MWPFTSNTKKNKGRAKALEIEQAFKDAQLQKEVNRRVYQKLQARVLTRLPSTPTSTPDQTEAEAIYKAMQDNPDIYDRIIHDLAQIHTGYTTYLINEEQDLTDV